MRTTAIAPPFRNNLTTQRSIRHLAFYYCTTVLGSHLILSTGIYGPDDATCHFSLLPPDLANPARARASIPRIDAFRPAGRDPCHPARSAPGLRWVPLWFRRYGSVAFCCLSLSLSLPPPTHPPTPLQTPPPQDHCCAWPTSPHLQVERRGL
jgi:hypothetical protein